MFLYCSGVLSYNAGIPSCDASWVELDSTQLASELQPYITAEVDASVLAQLYTLLQQAFSTPDPVDLAAIWFAGFFIPVLCYMVTSAYGSAINWFK